MRCVTHCPRPGSGSAAALAAVSLAVVVTSAAALISDVLALVLTVAAVLCAAGTACLVYLLHRDGLTLRAPSAREQPPLRLVSSRPAQALTAPRRLAIEAPTPHLPATMADADRAHHAAAARRTSGKRSPI